MVPDSLIKRSCDLVINSVRNSSLNYSLQETPYSIYITLRKSCVKTCTLSKSDQLLPNCTTNQSHEFKDENQVNEVKDKLKSLEEANSTLQYKYEEAVNDSEISYKQIKALEIKLEEVREADDLCVKKFTSEIAMKDRLIEDLRLARDSAADEL